MQQQTTQLNIPDFSVGDCRPAMPKSNAAFRAYPVWMLNRTVSVQHGENKTEYYAVTIQRLQNVFQHLVAALQQYLFALQHRRFIFRNCKPAFQKLQFALRHCTLKMLPYQPARLHCIHSPPSRRKKNEGRVKRE